MKPIKANLKFDTSGLSFDRAQEFTDHWWERAFNTAADNLSVDSSIGKVLLSIKDDEATEVIWIEYYGHRSKFLSGSCIRNFEHRLYTKHSGKIHPKIKQKHNYENIFSDQHE